MSSSTQLRRLLRTLMQRNSDLVLLSGRVLGFVPATHFGRCICIDNHPSRGYFGVEWQMHHFFEPMFGSSVKGGRTRCPIGRSTRYKPKGQGGLFEWDDPTMPGDFIDQVEAEILPLFRSLDTLEKSVQFVATYPHLPLNVWPLWMALTHVALGNIAAAQELWRPLIPEYVAGRISKNEDIQYQHDQWCRLTDPLMAGDRAALARLLHEWEARQIIGSKLEPYWKPTPFPIEQAA
jgi:hypothetical protein